MLTDTQLRDQALALLAKTTDAYPTWVKKGRPNTNWAKAFALLEQVGATPAPPAAAPAASSTNPVPPPSSGVLFGAYIEGKNTYGYYLPKQAPWSNAPLVDPGATDAWAQFEKNAGKPVKLLMFGSGGPDPWTNSFAAAQVYLDAVVARGAIPVYDVATGGTLADYTAGKYNAQITAWAKSLAAWGKPIVFRLDCEMNGTWYGYGAQARKDPASFVAMWRHVHDLFTAAGANNASWHWCPNVDPENAQTPLEQLYPGDTYVDWTGMTGYNQGGESCAWLFDSTYARLVKLAPGKPIMVGETGSVDVGHTGEKVGFIHDFFAALPAKYPQVKAFCWFNWRIDEGQGWWDWPIESSAESLAAFQTAVSATNVVGR
jgi:hypothetical protein